MGRVAKNFSNRKEKIKEIPEEVTEDLNENEEVFEEGVEEESLEPFEDVVTKEVTGITNEGREEHTLKITPSPNTEAVVVDTGTKFSDLSDHKVNFIDFYQDTRTFLAKANSTKFILITFLMITIPFLLVYNYISADVYKDMIVLLAISYLGVDVYEKKSMIKK
jgi:hypothetical protein